MLSKIKKLDFFTKNIILVFFGSTFANFLNLIYQLIIAHSFVPADFAAFNSLIAIFLLISTPIGTLQLSMAKYIASYRARNEEPKIKAFSLKFLKLACLLSLITLFVFCVITPLVIQKLKIDSFSSGLVLAGLLALAWFNPVLTGAVQGLEVFGWFIFANVSSGIIKLIATLLFIYLGFKITGALAAFLIANLIAALILTVPLRKIFSSSPGQPATAVNFKEAVYFLFPLAASNLCFMWLVSSDMIMVRYFFSAEDSGIYSLAQMAGKIFLFLPTAISLVLFPRSSSLKALENDTRHILRKSLVYAAGLGILAFLGYNLMPGLVLKLLTGKAIPQSVALGSLFSISMTIFAVLFVLINYFLSLKDLRFIKYLFGFCVVQFLAIRAFHGSLFQIQYILCINSVLLLGIHLYLAFSKKRLSR